MQVASVTQSPSPRFYEHTYRVVVANLQRNVCGENLMYTARGFGTALTREATVNVACKSSQASLSKRRVSGE